MSDEKDLSAEVKSVFHGEVLGPEEEPVKKSKEQEEIEILKEKLAQAERYSHLTEDIRRRKFYENQAYGQQNYYGQSLAQQFGAQNNFSQHQQRSNPFGCMQHSPWSFWPCRHCGNY